MMANSFCACQDQAPVIPLQRIEASLQHQLGYPPGLFSHDVPTGGGGRLALLAHSRPPRDVRTSAIAVLLDEVGGPSPAVEQVRSSGAPVALVLAKESRWTCWKVAAETKPVLIHGGTDRTLEGFLHRHRQALESEALYRAKTWGRLDPTVRQADFVDVGLLPVAEGQMGQRVRELLERVVKQLAADLGWSRLASSRADQRKAEWLIQAPFWLLAAKVLRDKSVPSFREVNLLDFEATFRLLARHYKNDVAGALVVPPGRQEALVSAATEIDRFASLGLLSTEALGFVYESTLINKATRKRLGTHSTPAWLIDYIVGRLRPWIQQMDPAGRRVFEPACGHAGFLVAALRLLDELRPAGFPEKRETYLRKRLSGVDVDPFSKEVARLALTLADVPNPNGWKLLEQDMFESDVIETSSRGAQIVLANPPFEMFKQWREGWLRNKAAETLARVARHLPPGGVIGFVLPQGILTSGDAAGLRREILGTFEVEEVTLFADKVFEFGTPEPAVLLARKQSTRPAADHRLRFQRVRENQVQTFARTTEPSSRLEIAQRQLAEGEGAALFVPELSDVWEWLRHHAGRTLQDFVDLGKGLEHRSSTDPQMPAGKWTASEHEVADGVPGFAAWHESQLTHLLPKSTWLNLDPEVIRRPQYGTQRGIAQVLLNYAPVSRECWRLKGLLDRQGHPVTSRFIVLRPRGTFLKLEALWGIMNSPIANAYAYCHLNKRDVLVGEMRLFPVPDLARSDLSRLEEAVSCYLVAAEDAGELPLFRAPGRRGDRATAEPRTAEELKYLHWRVDAEVLRLYGLPAALERQVLDLFAGVERRGVPFKQTTYFPPGLGDLERLEDLMAITAEWPETNRRRGRLIDLEEEGRLTPEQAAELAHLQRLADAKLTLLAPWQPDEVDRTVTYLKREGRWKSE